MAYKVDRVDVWAGPIKDRPGTAAKVLGALAEAGANLEFVIARRDKKGTGVIFLAPLKGVKQAKAALAAMSSQEQLAETTIYGKQQWSDLLDALEMEGAGSG